MNKSNLFCQLTLGTMSLFGAFSANAYIVASIGRSQLRADLPIHVVVAGQGREVKRQFAQAAISKAYRYADLYPNEQVIVISNREEGNRRDFDFFTRAGLTLIKADSDTLSGTALVDEMDQFSAIRSLDIFSHSAWAAGAGLEGSDYRIRPETDGIDRLKDNFTADAFATIHGCNSGYQAAPGFSEAWGIPVAGSFGSTDFQELHVNGQWYGNNRGQAPRGGWASSNRVSYSTLSLNCDGEMCERLRPDNIPYNGQWGAFFTGLGHYKFFCAYTNDAFAADAKCLAGVRAAVISQVSVIALSTTPSIEDYRTVVKDMLCPADTSGRERADCNYNLDRALAANDPYYSPFDGKPVACDLHSCPFDANEGGNLYSTSEYRSTTTMDEYRLLMAAYSPETSTYEATRNRQYIGRQAVPRGRPAGSSGGGGIGGFFGRLFGR